MRAQRLSVLLATVSLAWAAQSCKLFQRSSSATKAIVSEDGLAAFTLVPIRNTYLPDSRGELYVDDARKVENALRLSYVAVECTGQYAAMMANTIEDQARRSRDSVRRDGRELRFQLVDSSTPVKDCHIVGDYAAGPASWAGIFSQSPSDEVQFQSQQIAWLAARGQANLGAQSFSTGFLDFVSESLGAVPKASYAEVALAIGRADANFNPCTDGNSPLGFDKRKVVSCLEGKNYKTVSGYSNLREQFLAKVRLEEEAFIAGLQRVVDPKQKALISGWEVALKIDSTIAANVQLSGQVSNTSVLATQGPSPSAIEPETNPALQYLAAKSGFFLQLFELKIGTSLGPVYSYSNPRKVDMPPSVPPEQLKQDLASAKSGTGLRLLGGGRGWARGRRGNAYYQQSGTYYQYPVYQTVQYGQASTGAAQQGSTANWIYMGQTSQGDYMWKRSSDNAIYYADVNGSVTRNQGNGLSGTGNSASGTNGGGGVITNNGGGNGGANGNPVVVNNNGGGGVITNNGGGNGGANGNPVVVINNGGGGVITNNGGGNGGVLAGSSAGSSNIPAPATKTDAEKIREQLGWNGVSNQTLKDGATLPNFQDVVGYLPGKNGPYGKVDYISPEKAKETGEAQYNCQAYAADTCSRLDALAPDVSKGVFSVYGKDSKGEEHGHAMVWMNAGKNAAGADTFQLMDPQTGKTTSKPVTGLNEGLADMDLGKRYGVDKWTAGTGTGAIKVYDPKQGVSSVTWNGIQATGTMGKELVKEDGTRVPLYENGKPSFDYLPPNKLGDNLPVKETSQSEETGVNPVTASANQATLNPVSQTASAGTIIKAEPDLGQMAGDPGAPANSTFGGYTGSAADVSPSGGGASGLEEPQAA